MNVKFRYPVTPSVEVVLDASLSICLRVTGSADLYTISDIDDLIMGLKAARAEREIIEGRKRS